MERIWGGQKLAKLFGRKLPARKCIGESWEIVDRPEAQSVVASGPLQGKTLHELWIQHRASMFGNIPNARRFPLLIKLLDAREKLSLQVHPPEKIARKKGGEPKSEFWYVADAEPAAELLLGFRRPTSRKEFEDAIRDGTATDYVYKVQVKPGDAIFLPAGRVHAISAGNVLIEIQQNSDTTYRVFDWNRIDPTTGKLRQLHIEDALHCIDFGDVRPNLCEPKGELLVRNELFEVQKWNLDRLRDAAPLGHFAIFCCLTGKVSCANLDITSGEIFLVPAQLPDRKLKPLATRTSLLRVAIPQL